MEEILYTESYEIAGNDFEHGGDVSARIKSVMKELGLPSDIIRRLSIANFEAEMNVIMYAERATMTFTVTPDAAVICVDDRGQGIPDIGQAMVEGFSTATAEMRARGFGAGMGLPNIKRNTDTFAIESQVNTGTKLTYSVNINGRG